MSFHSSSSVNGKGSTPKDPLYKILDELKSLKLWKEKQEALNFVLFSSFPFIHLLLPSSSYPWLPMVVSFF